MYEVIIKINPNTPADTASRNYNLSSHSSHRSSL